VSPSSRALERLSVTFDEPTLVADAGLVVPATLMVRLGLEQLVDQMVCLRGRIGGALPGRKVLTPVAAILAGATHIDHADRLRAGAAARVLPFRVMAPSTLGTFLRSFTFGHVRQLDAVIAETIRRAWGLGAGPGTRPMTIDLDSTIVEVHGDKKQGAAYGYTKVLGYHPLLATRADTGEVLHVRMRKRSSQRGTKRFCEELVARVRRCGTTGPLTLRSDSGFFSWDLVKTLDRLKVSWSITVHQNASVQAAIADIGEDEWSDIAYPDGGAAQVAETIYVTGGGKTKRAERRVRLVVRRTRLTDPVQARLWPDWRHHAFITNLDLPVVEADRFHRAHATVELAIRDLSRRELVSSTARRGSSSPTPPGSAAPCSPTTSFAGPPGSVISSPTVSSPSPPAFAPTSSPSPAVSSTGPAGWCSVCPNGGRGHRRSRRRWTTCGLCRS
jgi:hypothetical protein